MENNSFTMLNEAGEEVKYDVLFTFDNEETNKSYIAYTDNTCLLYTSDAADE